MKTTLLFFAALFALAAIVTTARSVPGWASLESGLGEVIGIWIVPVVLLVSAYFWPKPQR